MVVVSPQALTNLLGRDEDYERTACPWRFRAQPFGDVYFNMHFKNGFTEYEFILNYFLKKNQKQCSKSNIYIYIAALIIINGFINFNFVPL